MAAFNKFNVFVEDLVRGTHNFASHSIRAYLTNTLPVATNAVKADIAEIAGGNGYTAGGLTVTVGVSRTGGTATLTAADASFTASGAIPTFRYVVLYNDTPTSPADPLIGWYDVGSAVTMANLDSFTVDFGASGLATLT